ncbi:MAG: hypothetical protein DCC88_00085 [Spirobacillus cienkowskii]|uniref:Integrase n=1 Tax=Spirobacillus cienkowskii TaxID=495820 RepID=A0A369KUB6_9BACT|nr:MAG: hypothetical protein DCC88_00085 [Spirobacillus cienkowskii]
MNAIVEVDREHTQIENRGSLGISLKNFASQIEQEQIMFLGSYTSINTIKNYERSLREFSDFCRSKNQAFESSRDIQRSHLDLYKSTLTQRYAHVPATAIAKLAPILSFLKFAHEQCWTERNVAASVKMPRLSKHKGKTEALSEDELLTILASLKAQCDAAKEPVKNRADFRAWLKYAIVATLAETGLRASELAHLKIKDLDLSGKHPRIQIKLKGGEIHAPLISDGLSQLLQTYLKEVRHYACDSDPLFTLNSYAKKAITRHQIAIYIREIATEHHIDKDITPHSLRATVASLLHQKNVPIGEIQQLLGHKSILTTMMYVRMTDEEKQSAGRKLNLLNQ